MSEAQQPGPSEQTAQPTQPGKASAAFKQQLNAAFDEIAVGQTFTFRRTFTDGDVAIFCGVTGDYNPYHIDDTFARESRFGRRIIPGNTASMLSATAGVGVSATPVAGAA